MLYLINGGLCRTARPKDSIRTLWWVALQNLVLQELRKVKRCIQEYVANEQWKENPNVASAPKSIVPHFTMALSGSWFALQVYPARK